jgi:hypothetical protein
MVHQAAGRGDQHVGAAREFLFLVAERHAADQQRHVQLVVLAVFLEAVRPPGRRVRGSARGSASAACAPWRGPGPGLLDHRQGEAGCLAGARLGNAGDVATTENGGDALFLDRCGRGVAIKLVFWARSAGYGRKTRAYRELRDQCGRGGLKSIPQRDAQAIVRFCDGFAGVYQAGRQFYCRSYAWGSCSPRSR